MFNGVNQMKLKRKNLDKSFINSIYAVRIKKLERLMAEKNIPSYNQLCEKTQIYPAALSKMLNAGTLSESYARSIETYLNKPKLWMDIDDFELPWDVPGFFFDNYVVNGEPDFYVSKTAEVSDFYIKLDKNIGFLHTGLNLQFRPIQTLREIRANDVCIIQHQKSKEISIFQFTGTGFQLGGVKFFVKEVDLLARCVATEF